MTEKTKTGVNPMLLGGVAAAVIALVIFVLLPQRQIAEAPVTEAAAPVSGGTDAVQQEPASQAAEQTSEATGPAAEDVVPEVAEIIPATPEPMSPEFDTFRVETDGSMVIAGRADPDQVVDIILGGEAIDRVTADASGSFVALPVAAPSDQPRRLSLLADPDGAAIPSMTSYIVAPIVAPVAVAEAAPELAEPAPEVAEPDSTVIAEAAPEETQTDPPTDTSQDAPVLAEVAADDTTQAAGIAAEPAPAPTVLQADADGVRIVQGAQAEQTDNVALDAITYDATGGVQLSGRATADGAVQVYVNNQPLISAPISEDGGWRLDLPEIDTGVYTLRIDEIDTEGEVVSRLETPFKREEPEDVAAVMAEETSVEGFEVAVRTVQPGSTLWAIAEESLGAGILYVAVFEANRDLIRDPDLIYPGQIFRIPDPTE